MKVAIVMGSQSDYEVMQKAEETLHLFGIETDTYILSAHRTPGQAMEFASNAEEDGYKVIIAAAGKAAHLAGVIAAHTVLPVIGVPMKTSDLGGMDSLLSTVQMPAGVPVATVAIGGADNAAVLAAQIIGSGDSAMREKLHRYKESMEKAVLAANQQIQ